MTPAASMTPEALQQSREVGESKETAGNDAVAPRPSDPPEPGSHGTVHAAQIAAEGGPGWEHAPTATVHAAEGSAPVDKKPAAEAGAEEQVMAESVPGEGAEKAAAADALEPPAANGHEVGKEEEHTVAPDEAAAASEPATTAAGNMNEAVADGPVQPEIPVAMPVAQVHAMPSMQVAAPAQLPSQPAATASAPTPAHLDGNPYLQLLLTAAPQTAPQVELEPLGPPRIRAPEHPAGWTPNDVSVPRKRRLRAMPKPINADELWWEIADGKMPELALHRGSAQVRACLRVCVCVCLYVCVAQFLRLYVAQRDRLRHELRRLR